MSTHTKQLNLYVRDPVTGKPYRPELSIQMDPISKKIRGCRLRESGDRNLSGRVR